MSKLETELSSIFAGREDALKWYHEFLRLCHAIDDLVDIPERRLDNEFVAGVLHQMLVVCSSEFYARNRNRLYSIFSHIHHTYFDSVKWEKSDTAWQKSYADITRSCAQDMLKSVVEIVVLEKTGDATLAYETVRMISIIAREHAWSQEHDESGKPL